MMSVGHGTDRRLQGPGREAGGVKSSGSAAGQGSVMGLQWGAWSVDKKRDRIWIF